MVCDRGSNKHTFSSPLASLATIFSSFFASVDMVDIAGFVKGVVREEVEEEEEGLCVCCGGVRGGGPFEPEHKAVTS
jgi:hypothetical protein